MHLLFATSIVPDGAPATGYEIANRAIIDALRRTGARVTILGFVWPGGQPEDPENTVVLGEVDVRNDTASTPQKLRWLARAWITGRTVSSAKLALLSVPEVKVRLAASAPFDAYVVNAVQFAGAYANLFQDRPVLYVAHNVEYRSAEESAAAAASPVERILFRREARLLKRLEATLCGNARFVFTLAEEDRALLGVEDDARSAALPLVTRRQPPPAPGSRRIECDAALIGTWTWQPNRIGLDWFLREVAPRLPADFHVRVAGRVPAGLSSSHPGIEFVGRVPDADRFIRAAAAIPLISRAGTGVQLKSIETFELGLPAVATTRSVRGIEGVPSNCFVTDDPAEFATALQAASATRRDLDGRRFYRAQSDLLNIRVSRGLAALGYQTRDVLV
jgi:hypothetical protein